MYSVPLLTFNLLIFLFIISLWTRVPILIHGLDPITLTCLYASTIPDLSNGGSHFLLCPDHGNILLLSDTEDVEVKLLLFLSQPWGYLISSRTSCPFSRCLCRWVWLLSGLPSGQARRYDVCACISRVYVYTLSRYPAVDRSAH